MMKSLLTVLLILMLTLGMSASALADGEEAAIGGVLYATLKEAVTAANSSSDPATIKLLKNITLGETLQITGSVTLNGADFTITRDEAYTKSLFNVTGSLHAEKLTIDGNNNWSLDEEGYQAALDDYTSSSPDESYFTPETGKPVATENMFVVSGQVILNGVRIKNHAGDSSRRVFNVSGENSSLEMKNTTIEHCATYYESTVVSIGSGATITLGNGTAIRDIFGYRNGIVSRVNTGGTLIIDGAEITGCKGVNSTGSVIMVYQGELQMKTGRIAENSNVPGPTNDSGAAVYIHQNGKFVMSGGVIENNKGRETGGIFIREHAAGVEITGGAVLNNETPHPDFKDTPNVYVKKKDGLKISGGKYSWDVNEWCVPGKIAILKADGYYHVVTGNKIFYYAAEQDESGRITGKTKIHQDFVEGEGVNAEPYVAEDKAANRVIREWYEIKNANANALARETEAVGTLSKEKFDYSRKLNGEVIHLCGFWESAPDLLQPGETIDNLPQTGDDSRPMLFAALLALSVIGLTVCRRRREN